MDQTLITLPSRTEAHLARIISVLGPPPVDVLHEAKYASRYFDTEGSHSSRLAMLELY